MSRPGHVFWFTGLSGAGKTTVAEAVRERCEAAGLKTLILDGDDVRERLHVDLGFTADDIRKNNALIAGLCEQARADHDVILVPIISPFRASRRAARERLGAGFHEIFCRAHLVEVSRRDTKGLYAKARDGEMENMIGWDPAVPYEPPRNPELVLDTVEEGPGESIKRMFRFVVGKVGPLTPPAR